MNTPHALSPFDASAFDFDGAAGLPDFSKLAADRFEPAFEAAMARHADEISAIADADAPASFDNTVAAMERAGGLLRRVSATFHALAGANTDDALQAVERAVSPRLSRHFSAISLNAALFARIDALYEARDTLGLDAESLRLLERMHLSFVRSGARLVGGDRDRLAAINARLSELGTAFSQNVLADEKSYALPVPDAALDGLPAWLVAAMAEAAEERGTTGHVVTLSRSLIVPFLTYCRDRALRETAFAAWTARGAHDGPHDNRPIMAETLRLRAEKAHLLGYDSFAAFKLADSMAKTPDAVRTLLTSVWDKARVRAQADAQALAALAAAEGDNAALAPSDWRYYAERRRQAEFSFDEGALKPYFQLDRMIEASFDVANRLFGLTFERVEDAQAWHPDARVWRVLRADGSTLGIFIGDYFARSSKRSGAWMSALRGQDKLDGGHTPIIYNICNFAKPAKGQPALLSMDDARTLFHEFGHALHGLLSDVTWPSLAGTAVSRDFVELPSQLYEHWLGVPQVLEKHALHVDTGQPLPADLLSRMEETRNFDAGFDTVEFTASALVDLALHELPEAPQDAVAAEAEVLARIGMPDAIVMRHRSPHFAHVFSGDGYASGYYSYMWSEVLDADAFEAFTETGDPFDPEMAQSLLRNIYSAGNSRPADVLYQAFRGRMPDAGALMRKRGLAA
ncbi:peptidyl-dipeptidase Dcp [Aureimonas altamirensis DSM 21988]|uniref:Peptidyl-dipeptidase Dcp n=1 Tax=Aureimonas altamirensis DSM 21988 TaxID=1121026 RepID=A0ABY1IDU3_9HYPH|nr:M3 family metallopeptidase [Aureimonas altamirensis]SHJ02680.1 peptidyl-dipeptidase Dcp [Aureimonas altamirensis DSM 21988]